MSTLTTNYEFKKPALSDRVSPSDYNDNFDSIDEQIKTINDTIEGHATSIETINDTLEGHATSIGTKANIASPVFTGTPTVVAATDYTVAKFRNIYAGTTDMTAGTTALANGTIYVMYE